MSAVPLQFGLLVTLIGGPILFGVLAWLARSERIRNTFIITASCLTAAAGLALAAQGPMVLNTGPGMRHLGDLLEAVLIAVVIGIGYQQRMWPVVGMGAAQGGVAVFEHFRHGAEAVNPSFILDPLSTILVLIISIVGSVIVSYGIGYMHVHEHHAPKTAASTGRFFFFLTGFLGLMNGLVLTDHLKWLSIFWEGTTLCSFFLIGHDRTPEACTNARRALLINVFGGLSLSLGAAWIQHQGGNGTISGLVGSGALLPMVLVLIATFTKSAQMPFQSWLLGAMVAPTPVSALLHSSTMVKAGSYLVLRLAPGFQGTSLATVVALAGAFTFAVASAIAISQSNAKKVLAYSTIANLGLIVACAGIGTPLAYAAALVILVYHAVSKALLFLCVGTIEQHIGSRNIDDMSGILLKMPLTTTIAAIGMVSMMAPPFGMLVGKWMAIVSSGHTPLVLLLLVIGSALTIFFWAKWLGRIITTAYHEHYTVEKLPTSMRNSLVLLAVLVILGGAFTGVLYTQYLRPLSLSVLTRVAVQDDMPILIKSVDEFMGWPLIMIIAVVAVVTVVALFGLRKTHPRLPFLCGENTPSGTRTFVFRSLLDEPVTAQVTSYYFAPWFGEKHITQWANPVAFLILLTLFARIGVL